MPVLNREDIYSARVALELHYELSSVFRLAMKSLVMLDTSFPIPSALVQVLGNIAYSACESLPAWKDSVMYDVPVLNFTQLLGGNVNALSWSLLTSDYADRDGIHVCMNSDLN